MVFGSYFVILYEIKACIQIGKIATLISFRENPMTMMIMKVTGIGIYTRGSHLYRLHYSVVMVQIVYHTPAH